jgi:hypothetical protein
LAEKLSLKAENLEQENKLLKTFFRELGAFMLLAFAKSITLDI